MEYRNPVGATKGADVRLRMGGCVWMDPVWGMRHKVWGSSAPRVAVSDFRAVKERVEP